MNAQEPVRVGDDPGKIERNVDSARGLVLPTGCLRKA